MTTSSEQMALARQNEVIQKIQESMARILGNAEALAARNVQLQNENAQLRRENMELNKHLADAEEVILRDTLKRAKRVIDTSGPDSDYHHDLEKDGG